MKRTKKPEITKNPVRDFLLECPTPLRCGHHDFKVLITEGYVKDHPDSTVTNWGACEYSKLQLQVSDMAPTKAHAVGTLFHEVLHALWFSDAMPSGKQWLNMNVEEHIVGTFENRIMAFYRNNPKFLDWMQKGLK